MESSQRGLKCGGAPHPEEWPRPDGVSRREWLRLCGLASTWLLLANGTGCAGFAGKRPPEIPQYPRITLTAEQFLILVAVVQNHLFPRTPGAPGAEDINATTYLQSLLADAFVGDHRKAFIREGANQLETLARGSENASFVALSSNQQEEVLRRLERTTAGSNWIANMLSVLFEALLSDPVYGGNPNEIGWAWLQHRPGYPRPPADKRYFLL